jgi:hypothetical protein
VGGLAWLMSTVWYNNAERIACMSYSEDVMIGLVVQPYC